MLLSILMAACSNEASEKDATKEDNKEQEEVMDTKRTTIRSTEFIVDNHDYIIDRNTMRYKTDNDGSFVAKYRYNNQTEGEDNLHIGVFYEGQKKPVISKSITVAGNSYKDIDINLSDVPTGNNVVYIITQTTGFDKNSMVGTQWNRNANYVAPYYFELEGKDRETPAAEVSSALPQQNDIQPTYQKYIDGNSNVRIYLSDKNGNEIKEINKEDLYLSLANPTDYELKGNLYNFLNGDYREFTIDSQEVSAFTYKIKPQTIMTFSIDMEDLKGSYVRFLATYIPPEGFAEQSPFLSRLFATSNLYIFS